MRTIEEHVLNLFLGARHQLANDKQNRLCSKKAIMESQTQKCCLRSYNGGTTSSHFE